ncbi:MAG: Fic family protein [Flavobacteriales bacterium]|nr:Fic family protein [Flavobacteriales bacterium]
MLEFDLNKIEELQKEIDRYGEFPKEVKDKIYYKLRLDWNYYSNSIEGGTLTREETRSVMSGVLNLKNKSNKDFREMDGHNRLVIDLFKLSKGEMRLAEGRIKDFHKQIMFDEDPEKDEQIGEWKEHNNEVINYRNEKITFAKVNEVPDLMHDLLNKLNAYLDHYLKNPAKVEKHPVEVAADFHVDFLTIHPFYDGNGRMARILSNLILIACGFPIFIISKDDKDAYNQLLSDIQAYGGDRNQFIEFVAERVMKTQEMILLALNGGDIEEEDDLDKEIELFKNQFKKEERLLVKSREHVFNLYNNSFKKLINEFYKTLDKDFYELFVKSETHAYYNNGYSGNDPMKNLIFNMASLLDEENPSSDPKSISVGRTYNGFNSRKTSKFSAHANLDFQFNEFNYEITWRPHSREDMKVIKHYDEMINKDEQNSILRDIKKNLFEQIKQRTSN